MLSIHSLRGIIPLPRSTQSLSLFPIIFPRYLSTPSSSSTDFNKLADLSPSEIRIKSIKLYKELHRLGRDYPDPDYDFNGRLRRAWEKNSKTKDPKEMIKQLELAEHIKKEVKALISLKKYRHLKRTYYAQQPESSSTSSSSH